MLTNMSNPTNTRESVQKRLLVCVEAHLTTELKTHGLKNDRDTEEITHESRTMHVHGPNSGGVHSVKVWVVL